MIQQKTTQNAITAVSRLAELYDDQDAWASSRDIAESRQLPVPIVAKILTELSRGGLVVGTPGPGGGYRLAKPPSQISLQDVSDLFEREKQSLCPYGPGWCGTGEPCPLHDSMLALQSRINDYLAKTKFSLFQKGTRRTTRNGRRR